jgi:hypothetical protein
LYLMRLSNLALPGYSTHYKPYKWGMDDTTGELTVVDDGNPYPFSGTPLPFKIREQSAVERGVTGDAVLRVRKVRDVRRVRAARACMAAVGMGIVGVTGRGTGRMVPEVVLSSARRRWKMSPGLRNGMGLATGSF